MQYPLPEQRVMSRNHKNTRSSSRRERAFITGNFLSFLSGLSIGLLVAFFVFLRYQVAEPDPGGNVGSPAVDSRSQTERNQPDVKFTFYDTLRNKKVNMSEWMAVEKDRQEEADDEDTMETSERDESGNDTDEQEQYATRDRDAGDDITAYVLQVGSFRDFSSADQVKAELALLGIFADIQRVLLNEQDVRHRVRLGPFKSIDEMRDIRRRLQDNQIEFVLLELRADQDTT